MWELLGKGFIAGMCYALLSMPLIPIVEKHAGCWRRRIPLFAGMALAEGIWSCLASVGLYLLMRLTSANPASLGLIGAIYVFIMALRSYRNHVRIEAEEKASFVNGLLLSLSFPSHFAGYMGILATLGLPFMLSFTETFAAPLGVIVGTAVYWGAFAYYVRLIRQQMHYRFLQRLKVTGAFVLASLALIAIIRIYI